MTDVGWFFVFLSVYFASRFFSQAYCYAKELEFGRKVKK